MTGREYARPKCLRDQCPAPRWTDELEPPGVPFRRTVAVLVGLAFVVGTVLLAAGVVTLIEMWRW